MALLEEYEYENIRGADFANDMEDPLFKTLQDGDKKSVTDQVMELRAEGSYQIAFMTAAVNEDFDLADYLLSKGAEVNRKDEDGWTPLKIVAREGKWNVAKFLIDKGANMDAQNDDGWTALMEAARKGNNDIVKLLIDKGANVNKMDSDGTTALMYAAKYCDKDVVNELIIHGAELNVQNNKDWTALIKAAKAGKKDVVKLLIDKGADVNTTDKHGTTALMYVAEYYDTDVVDKVITHGAEVNTRDDSGYTALMIAASKGNNDVVKLLIGKGADVSKMNMYGKTALMYAAQFCDKDAVNELITHGAELKVLDEDGWTALMGAAREGKEGVVNLLIAKGADVSKMNMYGKTALMYAAQFCDKDAVNELITHGAELKVLDEDGWTALMGAAREGKKGVVKILIDKGADVNVEAKKDSETALTLVREELVLLRSVQLLYPQKTRFMREENINTELKLEESKTNQETADLISVIERACGERFTRQEKEIIKKQFEKLPTYKAIREKLLIAGGYDVRNIENQKTKEKIKRILHRTDKEVLRRIVKVATKKKTEDAVISMLEFMIAYNDFVTGWNELFHLLPKKDHFLREDFLYRFTEAGNVEVLSTMLVQLVDKNPQADQPKSEQNTFLHTLAEMHDVKVIINLFQEINQKKTEMSKKKWEEERRKIYKYDLDDNEENEKKETSLNWLAKFIEMSNEKGYTFLAIAVNKIQEETESDMIRVLEWVIAIFGEDLMSGLCEKTDKGGNNLVHLAVRKSLPKLKEFILLKSTKSHEIFNKEGYNPLHLAVKRNDAEVTQIILQQKHFNINTNMFNGETALHISAQLGHCALLRKLIEEGGDLAMKDNEDGHTPLHDCLQQVYFEGINGEECYGKFLRVWNTIIEEAVTWWCQKLGKPEPANGSEEYMYLQLKAVYFLRSCIKNNNGLSVLQYAADRGLVTCVQIMLSAKDVFVKLDKTDRSDHNNYEIDVTNLCPEYCIEKSLLYSEEELSKLKEVLWREDKKSLPRPQQDRDGQNSFLDALAEVKPPNKAGEILESIPMISLSMLEWKVSQLIIFLWGIIHILVMILITVVTTNDSSSQASYVAGSSISVLYASVITVSHIMVAVVRWRQQKPKDQTQHFVKDSIKEYEKIQDDEGILQKLFGQTVLIVELLFTLLAWTVFVLEITNLDISGYVWIKGFFLLFGWLMLLIPMTSYGPVYKLISVQKYIIIRDMIPWIMIYITISIGFATAIKLQFDQLPGSSSCEDLTGFLNKTGHTFFELVIMTSGLDTDLKHVRNLACLFEDNANNVFVILFLITTYAVVSAVVLLNMLIAIMSNTVTKAQNDKGWRQYQINQTLWIREAFNTVPNICCCCSLSRSTLKQRGNHHNQWPQSSASDTARHQPAQASAAVTAGKPANDNNQAAQASVTDTAGQPANDNNQPAQTSVADTAGQPMNDNNQAAQASVADTAGQPMNDNNQLAQASVADTAGQPMNDNNQLAQTSAADTDYQCRDQNGLLRLCFRLCSRKLNADSQSTELREFFGSSCGQHPQEEPDHVLDSDTGGQSMNDDNLQAQTLDSEVFPLSPSSSQSSRINAHDIGQSVDENVNVPKTPPKNSDNNETNDKKINPKTGDMFLDLWIRGSKFPKPKPKVKPKTNLKAVYNGTAGNSEVKLNESKRGKEKDGSKKRKKATNDDEDGIWNKHNVRFDRMSHRWYLKLNALDVKEIRAKVWQHSLDKKQ